MENGAVILLVGTLLPRKELFLKVPRWEVLPLDAQQSMQLVRVAAEHFQVKLTRFSRGEGTPTQQQALATHSNGNPQFLIRAVPEIDIGCQSDPDQTEWIDGSPLVLGLLGGVMMLRYLALGLSNRNLMIMARMGMGMAAIARLMIAKASRKRSKIGDRS